MALYNAAGGPQWTDQQNWLTDRPLDEWHGVATNEDGRVTGIFPLDNNLSGSLPPELGDGQLVFQNTVEHLNPGLFLLIQCQTLMG